MVTGGNTALDPSRQSDQLRREGSLAYTGPHILTGHAAPVPPNPRANSAAENPPPIVSQLCR
jgi:hypothetical protein